MSNYKHRAFGLNIESDVLLDGLLPSNGPTDVYIREGKVPVVFPGPRDENAFLGEGEEAFSFRVKGIGAFSIRKGNEIIVEKHETAESDAYTLFILGTCMGALLMQRGLVPIHGSALSLENKQVIFTGQSGAGKSTLTASLNKMGYSFLADDITAVDVTESGEAWIMPAFPKQKLWQDTAIRIFGSLDTLERIPGIRDKYHVPMTNRFIESSKKLSALFELSTHPQNSVEIVEVKGAEKLSTILANTYRFEMVEVMGIQARHFLQCSKIASEIAVFKIRRPEKGFTVEEQIASILEVLKHI